MKIGECEDVGFVVSVEVKDCVAVVFDVDGAGEGGYC